MTSIPTVLVTGASGMIGTALIERLLAEGYSVIGVDKERNRWSSEVEEVTRRADLLDADDVSALPEQVDLVIHLAANARVHELVKDPRKARDNFEMTFNVLEYARERNVPRVIMGSSREVYANEGVIYGESRTRSDECRSTYAAGKIGAEAMASSYAQCYDLKTSILRFSNVYGRYDISNRVVPLFIARAHRSQDLTVFGEEKILDFTHLDDCIDGILLAIEKFPKAAGKTFNIASGEGRSLVELANAVIHQVPQTPSVDVSSSRTGEMTQFVADLSKARAILGYNPRKSPFGGIPETVNWYRERELLNEVHDGILQR